MGGCSNPQAFLGVFVVIVAAFLAMASPYVLDPGLQQQPKYCWANYVV